MAEDKPKRLTLRKMSEKRIIPYPIPHQLALLSEFRDIYSRPREELEAGEITPEVAEEAERKSFCVYSRTRAATYRAYAEYATGEGNKKNRERFFRKARNAENMADKYELQPVAALEELK